MRGGENFMAGEIQPRLWREKRLYDCAIVVVDTVYLVAF